MYETTLKVREKNSILNLLEFVKLVEGKRDHQYEY